MRKSILFKYYAACMLTILMSFLVLGSILVVLSVNYSNSEKKQLYFDDANNVAQMTVYLTEGQGLTVESRQKSMSNFLTILSRASNADILIVDNDGNGQLTTDQRMDDNFQKVSDKIMSVINSGRTYYENLGTFGGVFNRPYTIVGVPINYPNGQIIGGVFVYARADSLIKFVYDVIRIFIVCSLLVMVFTFIVIYFVTAKLVKPLKQMSAAAASFSKGDFTIRVPVTGDDEIGRLAVAFNNMASSLSALEDMRRGFVANVSHDLRTPMTSISGFIDGILDGTIPAEKREYYLQIVSNEVKRLSRLVHSLLDVAKIESGEFKLNYSEFDVAETIRRVVIGFEKQITDKNLAIEGLDKLDNVMVYSDADVTHRIIYNLIDNAVKFAGESGYIRINIAAPMGNRVYISIKNSGAGIAKEDIPYIFDRFYKSDKSRGLDKKGVGLGLYIVKTVLNVQGEDITVKSVEGEYCEFVFTLKRHK